MPHHPRTCGKHHRETAPLAQGERPGEFCCACSWEAQDYVWPCAVHEPGCLGNHLGDCAVSGMFTDTEVREANARLAAALAKAQNQVRVLTVVRSDLLAETWDDGYEAGHSDARAVQKTYPDATPNPYREAADGP